MVEIPLLMYIFSVGYLVFYFVFVFVMILVFSLYLKDLKEEDSCAEGKTTNYVSNYVATVSVICPNIVYRP